MTRTVGTPDDVSALEGEARTPPPMGHDCAPPCRQLAAPALSGSDRRHIDHGRWHDVAKVLAFIWAIFSSLLIGASFSAIPLADRAVTGPLWATYTAVATLAPWGIVFLVCRWPTIGAFALLAGFVLWLVIASQQPLPSYWGCALLCPAWLTLPPAAAIALHLARTQSRLPR